VSKLAPVGANFKTYALKQLQFSTATVKATNISPSWHSTGRGLKRKFVCLVRQVGKKSYPAAVG